MNYNNLIISLGLATLVLLSQGRAVAQDEIQVELLPVQTWTWQFEPIRYDVLVRSTSEVDRWIILPPECLGQVERDGMWRNIKQRGHSCGACKRPNRIKVSPGQTIRLSREYRQIDALESPGQLRIRITGAWGDEKVQAGRVMGPIITDWVSIEVRRNAQNEKLLATAKQEDLQLWNDYLAVLNSDLNRLDTFVRQGSPLPAPFRSTRVSAANLVGRPLSSGLVSKTRVLVVLDDLISAESSNDDDASPLFFAALTRLAEAGPEYGSTPTAQLGLALGLARTNRNDRARKILADMDTHQTRANPKLVSAVRAVLRQ